MNPLSTREMNTTTTSLSVMIKEAKNVSANLLTFLVDGLEYKQLQDIPADERCCAICYSDYKDGPPDNNNRVRTISTQIIDTNESGKRNQVVHISDSKEQDDSLKEDPVQIKQCGHIFGRTCLSKHLTSLNEGIHSRNQCPMCRQKLYHLKFRTTDKIRDVLFGWCVIADNWCLSTPEGGVSVLKAPQMRET